MTIVPPVDPVYLKVENEEMFGDHDGVDGQQRTDGGQALVEGQQEANPLREGGEEADQDVAGLANHQVGEKQPADVGKDLQK